MSDLWDVFFRDVDSQPASILVDQGIRSDVPDAGRPWLLTVTIRLCQPREDGLSSSGEFDRLAELEGDLVATLSTNLAAVFAGRVTTDGRREFYFYLPRDPGGAMELFRVMSRFPEYTVDWMVRKDPGWSHYRNVLSPTQEELRASAHKHALGLLAQLGDALDRTAPVRHWAFFWNAEQRETFAVAARELGFQVQSLFDAPDSDMEYGISVLQVTAFAEDDLDSAASTLTILATMCQGEYDGWEVKIG